MSTTPRTDAATGRSINNHYGPSQSDELYTDPTGPFVHASFARILETELIAMQARAEKAEADSKRLDWMEKYDWSNGFGDEVLYVLIQHRIWNGYELPSLRAAIDAAMTEASK